MAWLQAIPLLPIAALVIWHRTAPVAAWTLAAAFGVSWVGDTLAFVLGGSWAAVYWWLPVQIALAFWAVVPHGAKRLGGLFGIGFLAVVSATLTYPGPEVLTTMCGSALILALGSGRLSLPVWLYFGLGSFCYLLWSQGGWDVGWWWAYQGCRLAACLALVVVIRGATAHDGGVAET